jgi:hypothetical protein
MGSGFRIRVSLNPLEGLLEAISKKRILVQPVSGGRTSIAAGPRIKPEKYGRISRS